MARVTRADHGQCQREHPHSANRSARWPLESASPHGYGRYRWSATASAFEKWNLAARASASGAWLV
jgi:hypothetical protein